MKRFLSLTLTAALLCALLLSLTACSTYGKIEKAFLDAGYELVEGDDGDALQYVTDLSGEGEGEVSCTVHVLKKSVLTYAFVLEFDADKDAAARLDELMTDEDYRDFMEMDEKAKFLRGNCVLIPFSLNIFDAEADVAEMIELFNK